MVNRVATFPATDRLIMDNMRLQSALADTQTQLATGLKSLDYKGISDQTQRLLNVERNYTALKNYNTNGQMVAGNIGVMFGAVKSILDLANNFLTTLTSAQSGSFLDPQVVKDQAALLQNETAGLLNSQSGGRYLFAGSDIDHSPVNLAGMPVQTVPSTVNSSYYGGDNETLSVQLSETLSLSYGVKASDPAFEKLIRAFNLAMNNPGDKAALAESSKLMQESIDGLSNIYSQINTYARTVENQGLRNEEDMTVLDNLISNIKEVDLPATTVKQKELETQIQASYASSVKILNLKLTDYI